MSGYGATSASSRKIKVTMREHEGGDKVQRNCCFMFALVVGGLAAAFVAPRPARATSLSLEWTETDVVAVKAGNRIHYDDDVADDTTSSSDTENYSFWGFISKSRRQRRKCSRSCSRLSACGRSSCSGWWRWRSTRRSVRRKASENFVLLLCHAGFGFPAALSRAPLPLSVSRFTRCGSRATLDARPLPSISRQMVAHVHLVHFGVRDRAAAFLIHRERHGNEGPRISVTGYFTMQATGKCVFGRSRRRARLARAHARTARKRALLRACARTRYGTYFIFAGLATLLALGQVRGPIVAQRDLSLSLRFDGARRSSLPCAAARGSCTT